MSFIVAIDGTAGTGKGTVTKLISKHLGLINVDTGAMYRAVTLEMLNNNISTDELDRIQEILNEVKIEFKNVDDEQLVFLNDVDVTEEIRSKRVNDNVSQISCVKIIRDAITMLSRNLSVGKDVIMEGRDIGTVIFPDANVKIYLDATKEERAKRRLKQEQEKGIHSSYEEILANIIDRDNRDKTKEFGALKLADGAIYIDTTNLKTEEVQSKIEDIIKDNKNGDVKPVEEVKQELRQKKEKNKKEDIIRRKDINKAIKEETTGHKIRYNITGAILRFIYRVTYRVKIINQDRVPKDGAFILCGNHVSYFKVPVIVIFTIRKVYFIAKAELFKNPILKFLGDTFDVISVKRGKQDIDSMKKSLTVLKNGEVLGLFPEGTIKGMEKNVKVKTGAAYMALRAGVPIVPVGIKTTKGPFPKIILNYGEALDYSKYASKIPEKEKLEEITKEVMDNIIKLTNEAV